MLRNGLMFLTLCAFVIAVVLGVIISNEHFNRMVIPNQPVKLYHYAKQKNGDIQFDIMGESITVNPGLLIAKTEPYWQMAKQKFDEQIPVMQSIVIERWETLRQSQQVKAVNQWVKDKINERI